MAGLESMILAPRRDLLEPTHSLGALALVLLAHQVTDAARFLVFGMGVGFAAPLASGAAGVIGGFVLAGFAWAFPQLLDKPAARRSGEHTSEIQSLMSNLDARFSLTKKKIQRNHRLRQIRITI